MLYTALWNIITSRHQYGKNIYSESWDLLIILDACRVDALAEVKDEYEFLEDVSSIQSVGSTSKEWVERTFIGEYASEVSETTYITANGYSHHLEADRGDPLDYAVFSDSYLKSSIDWERFIKDSTVDTSDFERFISVFDLDGLPYSDHTRAENLTDVTIECGRTFSPNQCIVHYMQPHAPYIGRNKQDLAEHESDPFGYLQRGGDYDTVWNAYLDNLRYVLDHVGVLLSNYSADTVVITADHGDLFGEWGLYNHGPGILQPDLRTVPWIETTAEDTNTPEPRGEYEFADDPSVSDEELEQHLEALGYK